MSKKFQIAIPKPCHENWDKMTPVEQGRFCNSCQKAVVDFTGMSDGQLIAYFKKPSTGSVCGRFDNDQLQRDFTIPGKRMPWLKYFLNLLVPAFLISNNARSQGAPKVTGDTVLVDTKKAAHDKNGNAIPEKIDLTKVRGRVVDRNGNPIPFATVTIKETIWGTTVDADGHYQIDLSRAGSNPVLEFSGVGFMSVEIPVAKLRQRKDCVVILDAMLSGEVVVTRYYSREKKKKRKQG